MTYGQMIRKDKNWHIINHNFRSYFFNYGLIMRKLLYICIIMKHIVFLITFAIAFSGGLYARIVRPIHTNPGKRQDALYKPVKLHSDNTLIIFYEGNGGKKSLMSAVKNYGATVICDYGSMNGVAIKLPQGKNVDEAKAHFEKVKGVVQVNYDKILQLK